MKKQILASCMVMALAPLAASAADTAKDASNAPLEIYSARGDTADEKLFADFVATSGIQISRTENSGPATLAALEHEGEKSPADVALLDSIVDFADGQAQGVFKAVQSKALDGAIPSHLRASPAEDGAVAWFGLARNPRIVVYRGKQVKAADVATYELLASKQNRGKLCLSAAPNPANLGLLAAMIEHVGPKKAKTWFTGLQTNLARTPTGDDTEQIRAVADGQCQIAITSQADLARLMRSDSGADRDVAAAVAVVFPNQKTTGTYADIAGAAIARHAKHPEQALGFVEYLASEHGQNLFANHNNMWPAAQAIQFENRDLETMLDGRELRLDDTAIARIATHLPEARKMVEDAASGHPPTE